MKTIVIVAALAASVASAFGQTPPAVRPIPPPGIEILEADRAELTAGVEALGKEIAALRKELKPELLAELPNVEIFHKAVDWALRYGELFEPKQIAIAKGQLAQGMARAAFLRKGETPWNRATGLVVRAYRSKIDGSVQPYGMVVPADWKRSESAARRLDIWLRGRSEKGTEVPFIHDRQTKEGEFAPPGVFVLHPFGRYCNANRFAGEIDTFEALEDVHLHYQFQPSRVVVRGFSMGGAACWQFATHHSGLWAAAAPGAGFAETAEFFKSFAPGKEPPPWWEQVLWRWYDCTTMAANLANVPTIAYSGELDGQKQAADIMLRYAEKEGLTFPHIIGPQTAHKYHPESKAKIEEFVTKAMEKGQQPAFGKTRITTYSVMYQPLHWIQVHEMERQWERADITVELTDQDALRIATNNVSHFAVDLPRGVKAWRVIVDGQTPHDGKWTDRVEFWKDGGKWMNRLQRYSIGKSRNLCGPIDHAFMSRFVFVRPTGKPLNDKVGAWAKAELDHAIEFWRKVFRGDAPVKDDTAITDDDIENSNLVLWGDPSSNAVLKQIVDRSAGSLPARSKPSSGQAARAPIPLTWSAQSLDLGGAKYDPAHHAPILIFPNPLNPSRYVVLNSGPTFREQALLNNSDQTPKLPDWAVIDLRTPPGPKWPGLVVDAGFFDEQWRLPAK